ncbi:MAG: T9SS type A sorting domain-containing protein [Bacteroidota bacterium]
MKHLYISLFVVFIAAGATAQTIITDTVSLGAGYANQVWYSLLNDNQGSAPKNNWDLAFDCTAYGTAIHINSVTGTQLWLYPSGDTAAWANVDTTGITGWIPRYNSDTSWVNGALNLFPASAFDIGWGIYNPVTHIVTGDSLFIIKLSDGSYRKLWIQQLGSGIYTVRAASLNNSNDVVFSIDKLPYSAKNFVYYSLQTNAIVDREPSSANWDLLFTQYTTFIPTPYTVAGVLHNYGTTSAELHQVDVTTASHGSAVFGTAINGIGYDWKQFAQTGWVIEDSLVYFVQTQSGDIWKLVFTGFGGSANGNFIFTKELVSATAVDENQQMQPVSSLWPNPAHNQFTLMLGAATENVEVEIFDQTGRIVDSVKSDVFAQLMQFETENWTPGLYHVRIVSNNSVETLRIIIN